MRVARLCGTPSALSDFMRRGSTRARTLTSGVYEYFCVGCKLEAYLHHKFWFGVVPTRIPLETDVQDSLETASSDHEDGGVPSSRQSASPAWDCSSGTGSEGSSPKRARREASQDPSLVVASGVGSAATAEANACKWKASNFPAVSLRIGGWERTSQYMGDLVSKVYFAKRKLVWEILEGGLKSKVEVQWADISALQVKP